MDFDHLAEQRSERVFATWVQNLFRNSPEELAGKLATRHRPGTPVTASRYSSGAFNVCYRVTYQDGFRALVRFAALGRVKFRNEKVQDEVEVMEYLAENTSIPVPKVLGSGKCALGPYIVMTIIEGKPLSSYLRDTLEERVTLNPRIHDQDLKRAYRGMAQIMLELSKPAFPRIGALGRNESGVWTVTKRPLSFNMNRLAEFSNIPPCQFATQAFANAAEYFEELARQHLLHLEFQRNDAVTDEADCRRKYVARCLFRKISQKVSTEYRNGPFRLFCDDLRPDNVLVDVSKQIVVTGVIDWEFTYVAPAEFTYIAPWWLLLELPEEWESDLNQFMARYIPRLHVFLDALRELETERINEGTLFESQRLSRVMDKFVDNNGLFWICLAARYSSMFDEIYWTFIDPMYHGPITTIDDRVVFLTDEERENLSGLIQTKMQQAQEGTLVMYQTVDEMLNL